ncbi:MAG TPA: MMPL family transporter [Acidimicrobiales bacterium]|nr:MMPL family transporter [Acidimicrobiales bacterium]
MSKPTLLVRLADWSYRRRRLVLLLWVLLLVGTIVASNAFKGENDFTFTTPGSDSERAQQLLEDHFPARSGDEITVVFAAKQGKTLDDPALRSEAEAALARFGSQAHVNAVESPFSPEGGRQISPKRTIGYATLRLDVTVSDYEIEDGQAMVALAKSVQSPTLQTEVGGFTLQGAEQEEFSSEGLGLILAAIILLISFGSLLAMGLPILVAVFGLGIGLGIVALLANVLEVPDFAPQVAGMIGIGVGIDYVLFIITRYRTALHGGLDPRAAVITAITTSGRAVIFAGCVVIISLLGLFVMNLGFLRGLAVGAVSAVLVVMLAAVTLLPALLGFVGTKIDSLRVPFVNRKETGDRTSLSYRWSRVVQRYPWPAALACLIGLGVLSVQAFSMDFGFPDAGNSPEEFSVRRSYDLLTEGFGPGFNGPLFLVAQTETAAVPSLAEKVRETPGIAFVGPPVVSPDGKVALLAAYPTTSPQADATERLVSRLRRDVLPRTSEGAGAGVFVGGATAGSIDATRYVAGRLPLFIGAVIVLSFLLLLAVFRSVLVPLKAAIMNLLSVGAAYGVVALMVQGGAVGSVFGINEPVPVPSFIPMMMFAILFGLSMDYEVFLLSRIREEYVRTGDNATAVADGLAHTARVITAAAAIMISVFLAFVLADEVFLKMIGVGLATAILVDATIIRMILVPATMELLGDANWWLPDWLARRLPQFHVEGESAETIQAELESLERAQREPVGL